MAAPPPPAAAALPAMVPTQVDRVKDTVDGLPVDQLRTIDGRGCIQLIRTLRPALSELGGAAERYAAVPNAARSLLYAGSGQGEVSHLVRPPR